MSLADFPIIQQWQFIYEGYSYVLEIPYAYHVAAAAGPIR